MNNKGFTLVEILGVIVVLGAIGLIAGNFFTNSVDSTKKTITASQKNSILNAAEMWSVENTSLIDENDNLSKEKSAVDSVTEALNKDSITMCITTEYLYKNGYISTKDIKLEDDESFSGYIIISNDETNNQYKFRIASTDEEINSCKNHLITE